MRVVDEYECWCGEVHKVHSITPREGRSVLNEKFACDLVRRAKKLAGVGE